MAKKAEFAASNHHSLFARALALHPSVVFSPRLFREFFADDGMISLRYTQRLLEGKGLTWEDADRVEGYSNLLWVLLCAVPGLFGSDLIKGTYPSNRGCLSHIGRVFYMRG